MFDTFPVLQSALLDLIEMKPEYAPDILNVYGNKKLTAFNTLVLLVSMDDALGFIDRFCKRFANKTGIRWGISLKGQNRIIGTIGFKDLVPGHKAVIGYDIHPDYWNRGYSTEAMKMVLDFAFNTLHLNRVEAEVMPGNIASEKVLTKNGFSKEGILRQFLYCNGKHYDVMMFSMLRADYANIKSLQAKQLAFS